MEQQPLEGWQRPDALGASLLQKLAAYPEDPARRALLEHLKAARGHAVGAGSVRKRAV
jgi:hypothetical protein